MPCYNNLSITHCKMLVLFGSSFGWSFPQSESRNGEHINYYLTVSTNTTPNKKENAMSKCFKLGKVPIFSYLVKREKYYWHNPYLTKSSQVPFFKGKKKKLFLKCVLKLKNCLGEESNIEWGLWGASEEVFCISSTTTRIDREKVKH